jgi:hypothetical protein
MHIKRDFSGIREGQKKLFIIEGHANINISYIRANPIVITDAIQTAGVRQRAAVSEYEPAYFREF